MVWEWREGVPAGWDSLGRGHWTESTGTLQGPFYTGTDHAVGGGEVRPLPSVCTVQGTAWRSAWWRRSEVGAPWTERSSRGRAEEWRALTYAVVGSWWPAGGVDPGRKEGPRLGKAGDGHAAGRDGEKWVGTKYSLEEGATHFPDGLDVGQEGEERGRCCQAVGPEPMW